MTRMTIIHHRQGHDRGTWAVAEAKARFSELIDRALADGPQTITRNGQNAVVVVSAEEWQRKTRSFFVPGLLLSRLRRDKTLGAAEPS